MTDSTESKFNMEDLNKCYKLILNFMKGDQKKATVWFYFPNPLLGGDSPLHLILTNRVEKLLGFIKNNIEGNFP